MLLLEILKHLYREGIKEQPIENIERNILAIRYTNNDLIYASQQNNNSLIFPSEYWDDKIAQISIEKPNLQYYTNIVSNFTNVNPSELMRENGIELKLSNDVIEGAKEGFNGIIEIPNRIWNGIVTSIDHQDQSFFNKLYLDVSDVNINIHQYRIESIRNVTINEVTQNILPSEGYDAMGTVHVTVSPDLIGQDIRVQDKSVNINENGLVIVTPDVGYNGLGEVQINTNVPSDINNQNKSIEIVENGTRVITADQGYSGIGTITLNVNVPENEQLNIQQVKRYELTSVNTIDRILPDEGYDAMYSVDASIDVSSLLSTLNLNVTSEDLYDGRAYLFGNVMSPSVGWNKYQISINVSDVIGASKDIISKMRVYYQNSTVSQSERLHQDVLTSSFVLNEGSSINVNQGYSYLIIYNDSSNYYLSYLNANSNSSVSLPGSPENYYLYNFGPAKYIEIVSYRETGGSTIVNLCEYKMNDEHISQGRLIMMNIPMKFFEIGFENNG